MVYLVHIAELVLNTSLSLCCIQFKTVSSFSQTQLRSEFLFNHPLETHRHEENIWIQTNHRPAAHLEQTDLNCGCISESLIQVEDVLKTVSRVHCGKNKQTTVTMWPNVCLVQKQISFLLKTVSNRGFTLHLFLTTGPGNIWIIIILYSVWNISSASGNLFTTDRLVCSAAVKSSGLHC